MPSGFVVSDETMARLKMRAVPLEDDGDSIIAKLLDEVDAREAREQQANEVEATRHPFCWCGHRMDYHNTAGPKPWGCFGCACKAYKSPMEAWSEAQQSENPELSPHAKKLLTDLADWYGSSFTQPLPVEFPRLVRELEEHGYVYSFGPKERRQIHVTTRGREFVERLEVEQPKDGQKYTATLPIIDQKLLINLARRNEGEGPGWGGGLASTVHRLESTGYIRTYGPADNRRMDITSKGRDLVAHFHQQADVAARSPQTVVFVDELEKWAELNGKARLGPSGDILRPLKERAGIRDSILHMEDTGQPSTPLPTDNIHLRPEVRWFAEQLEIQLRHLPPKTDLREASFADLIQSIYLNEGQLIARLSPESEGGSRNIAKTATEIAAYALMLAYAAQAREAATDAAPEDAPGRPIPADTPEIPSKVYWAIFDERRRQIEMWGDNRKLPIGVGLAIIQEEVSEIADSLLEIAGANNRVIGYRLAEAISNVGILAREFLETTKNNEPGPGVYDEDACDIIPDGKLLDELIQAAASTVMMMASIEEGRLPGTFLLDAIS